MANLIAACPPIECPATLTFFNFNWFLIIRLKIVAQFLHKNKVLLDTNSFLLENYLIYFTKQLNFHL